MNNVALAYFLTEFMFERKQGRCGIVLGRLHLYGEDLELRLAFVGKKKVDFHGIPVTILIVFRIKEKFSAFGAKHLRYGIFIKHAFVKRELSHHNTFIQLFRGNLIFAKGVTH